MILVKRHKPAAKSVSASEMRGTTISKCRLTRETCIYIEVSARHEQCQPSGMVSIFFAEAAYNARAAIVT